MQYYLYYILNTNYKLKVQKIYIMLLNYVYLENKLDSKETLELVTDDVLKEIVPTIGERLLAKKVLNQFLPVSSDKQCSVCWIL